MHYAQAGSEKHKLITYSEIIKFYASSTKPSLYKTYIVPCFVQIPLTISVVHKAGRPPLPHSIADLGQVSMDDLEREGRGIMPIRKVTSDFRDVIAKTFGVREEVAGFCRKGAVALAAIWHSRNDIAYNSIIFTY